MNFSLSKIKDIGVGLIIGLISYTLFLGYGIFFKKIETPTDLASVNTSLLGPKLQKAATIVNSPTEKISFKKKDLLFSETPLYQSFVNDPESVSLSEKRGRDNPFVPYAP